MTELLWKNHYVLNTVITAGHVEILQTIKFP